MRACGEMGPNGGFSSHVSESMVLYKASLHCHSVGHSVASLGRLGFHKKSVMSKAM